jgi:hypothetical protein
MKKSTILLLALVIGMSCKKEEKTPPTSQVLSESCNFIDQQLQGKVFGNAWEFKYGFAMEQDFVGEDSITTALQIALFNVADSTTCNYQADTAYVNFTLDNMSTGVRKLNFENGNMIIFQKPSASGAELEIALDGCYEIVSIDTVNKLVSGKIDAYFSEDNKINGTFEIPYCR